MKQGKQKVKPTKGATKGRLAGFQNNNKISAQKIVPTLKVQQVQGILWILFVETRLGSFICICIGKLLVQSVSWGRVSRMRIGQGKQNANV